MNAQTQFTPGPWEPRSMSHGKNFSIHRVNKDDGAIAQVYGTGDEIGANDARLIAAAPELYEALRNLLDEWKHIPGTGGSAEARKAAMNAETALRKAGGE